MVDNPPKKLPPLDGVDVTPPNRPGGWADPEVPDSPGLFGVEFPNREGGWEDPCVSFFAWSGLFRLKAEPEVRLKGLGCCPADELPDVS